MIGAFLSLCLSALQLKQPCPPRTPDERDISEFMFICLTIEQSCPTRTPNERGISEFIFICLTIEAVLSYQDIR